MNKIKDAIVILLLELRDNGNITQQDVVELNNSLTTMINRKKTKTIVTEKERKVTLKLTGIGEEE